MKTKPNQTTTKNKNKPQNKTNPPTNKQTTPQKNPKPTQPLSQILHRLVLCMDSVGYLQDTHLTIILAGRAEIRISTSAEA